MATHWPLPQILLGTRSQLVAEGPGALPGADSLRAQQPGAA